MSSFAGAIIRRCAAAVCSASTSSRKFQWDARDPGDDPPDFDDYEIHRARIGIEGEFFNRVQFSHRA